ncbi:MAG TPA: hypothetical protein VNC84_02415 [Gammaproteobacteria bacterium]|jgi:hypothetical protein|nr:hypothetical protein [Gammaproteobacteria bacterium]
MNTALETKVKNWVSIYPYVHVPDNRTEYNELLKFANKKIIKAIRRFTFCFYRGQLILHKIRDFIAP